MARWFMALLLFGATAAMGCDNENENLDGAVPDLSIPDLLGVDLFGVDASTTHIVMTGAGAAQMAFSPVTLTIRAGETVRWEWIGTLPHTVTSQAGPNLLTPDGRFCSGAPDNPSVAACTAETSHTAPFTFEHLFPTPGITYNYYCKVHGLAMQGVITVQ